MVQRKKYTCFFVIGVGGVFSAMTMSPVFAGPLDNVFTSAKICALTGVVAAVAALIYDYKLTYKAWYDRTYTNVFLRSKHKLGIENYLVEYFIKFKGHAPGHLAKGTALFCIGLAGYLCFGKSSQV